MRNNLNVKGTRDYYPELKAKLNYIFDIWRSTAKSYGYEEYDGPIIETLELYKIKSGDEIVNQLYSFKDKGGRDLALRPELTPTLARMVSKIYNEVQKPIKWFSIPRCLRYEKPQKGRLREFFQFNVDIIGEEDELADAEIISIAIDVLIRFGLSSSDFVVKINNRNFSAYFFEKRGIDEQTTAKIYKIVDNARKVPWEVTESSINDLNISVDQKNAVFEYLRIKDLPNGNTTENAGAKSLVKVFEYLRKMGLEEFCEFDPTIVRGLDYYTGTVFEVYDKSEKMRAICGGGRYNRLVREFLGVDVPGCGFGMGDVVLGEILELKGLLPEYKRNLDYYMVRFSDDDLELVFKISRALRGKGFSVDYSYKIQPVKKQMSRASKLGAKYAVLFGPDEIKNNKVKIKDLSTGREVLEDIENFFK